MALRAATYGKPRWLAWASALALVACERTIVLGERPQEDARDGAMPAPDAFADAPPIDVVDAAPPDEDCSASIPPGILAATPPMGWNPWNFFGCMPELNEAKVRAHADLLVSSGMQAAGYHYVNLDDCWQGARKPDGTITASTTRFPGGIEPLSQYIHELGLNFGLYSPTADCNGTPGSFGFEDKDAQTYAAWKVDYLKYRVCSPRDDLEARYRAMGNALTKTGRAIVFSMAADPFEEWMATVGQLRRTAPPITATWTSILSTLDVNALAAAWARPGGFNDPDMLEVGNGALTESESRAHFTLWSIMAAPLLAGNDLTAMTESTKAILTNTEVIALDQDPLGLQGAIVQREGDVQVFAKPLASCGERGVVLFNRGPAAANVNLDLSAVWLASGPATVRDLWAHASRDPIVSGMPVSVPSHDVVALKITGVEPARPRGDAYLSDAPWTYATNGYGPVERNASNGEMSTGDGKPIRVRGRTYAKGLGTHAPSLVRYRLGQACSRFTADVGVDDESAGLGSVVFEVWADGQKLFDSGRMTGSTPARHVDVDLTGRRDLRLFVGPGHDNNSNDHADWADAQVTCRP